MPVFFLLNMGQIRATKNSGIKTRRYRVFWERQ